MSDDGKKLAALRNLILGYDPNDFFGPHPLDVIEAARAILESEGSGK